MALAFLEHTPPERLSIREVARAAGVSHQAPYVHFGGKRGFLAAVAGVGLEAAAQRAGAAVEVAGPDPDARIHALVDAYHGFATQQPNLHDLAFGPLVAKADHPDLQRAAAHYWRVLQGVVEANQPAGVRPGEVLNRCSACWGLIHGLGRLSSMGQIPQIVPGDLHTLMHAGIETLLRGWNA
ncbi:TetR/AcrR family transcriptional regulator [Sinomonas sp. ASV322]|uniref:TetR/AcrR family transcriptional regulator n=1 Tax=Sinomonas sp. ASV322 TaxID=3041920 RepID=UPI0027DC6EEE|nr:TetR/AcrR family transcriptional regulator [Sinomonas sp. ASV322]MDQ4504583.1 TetR/AcrR family transcriptional regulator [Sinomonas sp. ASV322]